MVTTYSNTGLNSYISLYLCTPKHTHTHTHTHKPNRWTCVANLCSRSKYCNSHGYLHDLLQISQEISAAVGIAASTFAMKSFLWVDVPFTHYQRNFQDIFKLKTYIFSTMRFSKCSFCNSKGI